MSRATRVAGLLVLCVAIPARGQAPTTKPDTAPPASRWTILFRSDDPSLWGTNAKDRNGQQVAIPLRYAPDSMRYLRLRRMDTFDTLILPLTRDQLRNGKVGEADASFWWNGSADFAYGGHHLGIVQAPRHKFPGPNGMIDVQNDGWDAFAGSGFGHKYGVGDRQYYCWRGKEIRRTTFEIAVSDGPLTKAEEDCLVSDR
jgi:hypothetical protein